jgi:hypothetical protein
LRVRTHSDERDGVFCSVKDDGTVLGIKAKMLMDQGAYPGAPFPMPASPMRVTRAPHVGEHTEEILGPLRT